MYFDEGPSPLATFQHSQENPRGTARLRPRGGAAGPGTEHGGSGSGGGGRGKGKGSEKGEGRERGRKRGKGKEKEKENVFKNLMDVVLGDMI